MKFTNVLRALAAVAVSTTALVAFPAAASATPAAYQIVVSPPVTIPGGGGGSTYAQCPSGIHVAGGGGLSDYAQNPGAVVLRSSYPAHLDGVDRWAVQAHNTGQQPLTLRAYAVCVGGLSQYEIRKQTDAVRGGEARGIGSGCPDPAVPELGGGFDIETGWGFRVAGVVDFASSAGHYRGPSGINTSAENQQWSAYVVCGSGLSEVQLVENRSTTAPAGIAFIDVSCPAGKSVLAGGGGASSATPATALLGSYPLSSTQWRTILRVDEPAGVRAEGWAVCAR